jgi:hypothetical protein
MILVIFALAMAGCATTPDGEMTDGSKTAWLVGGVLVGSAIIAMALSDDSDDSEPERDCFIRLNPDGSSETICR